MAKKAAPAGLRAPEFLAQKPLPRHSAYCLVGTEDFLREEILTRLRQELLDPGFAEFNHTVLRCSSALKSAALQDALLELPVMTDVRLVELRNAEQLAAKQLEGLAPVLAQLWRQGGVALVACFEAAKSKAELADLLGDQALTVILDVEDKDRLRWAQQRAAALALEIDPKGLDAVVQRTGGDLRSIAGHLEKLKAFGGPIGVKEVEQQVPLSAEVQTWRLTAAIGRKDLNEAYQVLDRLLERGEVAGSLLSYLNSYLGSLAQIKHLKNELKTVQAIAQAMPRKNEFQIKKSLEEAATWSDAHLEAAFDRLTRADWKIKTGEDERLLLQLLVLQLTSR